MLARWLTIVLPDWTLAEAIETTCIHDVNVFAAIAARLTTAEGSARA